MPAAHDLPLIRQFKNAAPLGDLNEWSTLPGAFQLSFGRTERNRGWTILGADPFAWYRGGDWDAALTAFHGLARRRWPRDPSDARLSTPDGDVRLPFTGGAVGYWAYDFGRRLERLPSIARDDLGLPDFVLGFYDVVLVVHHATGTRLMISSGLPFDGAAARTRAAERLESFTELLLRPQRSVAAYAPREPRREARSSFTRAAYERAVEDVREHIRHGDIFQANLSQRWTVPWTPEDGAPLGGPAAPIPAGGPASPAVLGVPLMTTLATQSAAPWAAYFDAGDHAIVSASPESFLEVRGRTITSRPIKGTRPRGNCEAEDEQLASELTASAKDRAENVMIVDVLRNDLGRVCEPGSIAVPELCALETFPQVFHLTSTVTGALREDVDAFDAFTAAFPGGSITGAPKIRAMEILESLEPVRRHIYTGSIGAIDWSGAATWNIAIRTALVVPGAVHFAAGGGITADSDPALEYLETLHKAEGLRLGLGSLLQFRFAQADA